MYIISAFDIRMSDIRLNLIKAWLELELKLNPHNIHPASGDASFRRYFRFGDIQRSYIVMDAPPEQEDIAPFARIARALKSIGINAPEIVAEEKNHGFLLLSDLGKQLYLDELSEDNANSLYQRAIDALVLMQRSRTTLENDIPPYDRSLLLNEMMLFRDWLLQKHLQLSLNHHHETTLLDHFDYLATAALSQPDTFVHRDYHSRNIMHIENSPPGILDFQDAVIGPICYDLVSLLKDCYIAWPRQQTLNWCQYYFDNAQEAGILPHCEFQQFIMWFDLMGVQRHLKASGIFARLYHRDGKDGYLKDIPRTLNYIVELKGLYPQLTQLITLIENDMLPLLMEKQTHG